MDLYLDGKLIIKPIEVFSCPDCGKEYNIEVSLAKHRERDHNYKASEDNNKPKKIKEDIFCGICHEKCFSKGTLAKHVKKKHKEITIIEYAHKYIPMENPTGKCMSCKVDLPFKGLGIVYDKFCSFPCGTKWYNEHTTRVDKSLKTREKKKEDDPNFELSPVHTQYWINKGKTEEEAVQLVHERQQTFSLKICIEKHGEAEGTKIWQERQDKWQKTLKNKSPEELERIAKAKLWSGGGFSKISQELFIGIYNKFTDVNTLPDIYFAQLMKRPIETIDKSNKNHEFCMIDENQKVYLFDFYVKDIEYIIEFDGDFWHGVQRGRQAHYDEREKNILICNPKLTIRHIKEKDFNADKTKAINDFYNEILQLLEAKKNAPAIA